MQDVSKQAGGAESITSSATQTITGCVPVVSLSRLLFWYDSDYKQLLDEVFVKPKAEADNTYLDLDYSGYHKNRTRRIFSILRINPYFENHILFYTNVQWSNLVA